MNKSVPEENAGASPPPRGRPEREGVRTQLRRWSEQEAQVRARYPEFDLNREVRSRNFLALLRAGVPMLQAYEVIHLEEIKAAATADQAKQTERAVMENIKAKGTRPRENGTGTASGFTVKDDVARLTPRDRAEIARRAARGEVITF